MLNNFWVSFEGKRDGEKFKLLEIRFDDNLYEVYRGTNKLYNVYPRQLDSKLNLSFSSDDSSIFINNLFSEDVDLGLSLDKGYAYALKVKDKILNKEYYVLNLNLDERSIKYNKEPYNKDVYDREDYFEYSHSLEGIKSEEKFNDNMIIKDLDELKDDDNLELNLYIRVEDKYQRLEDAEMWVTSLNLK